MSKNNEYTTGNLLDFAYFKKDFRLIAIDLSKQTILKDPQQIYFTGRFERQGNSNKNGATIFFIIDSESNGNYSHENSIKFLTKSIESSLCNYSDAYILVAGNIAVTRGIATADDNPIQKY